MYSLNVHTGFIVLVLTFLVGYSTSLPLEDLNSTINGLQNPIIETKSLLPSLNISSPDIIKPILSSIVRQLPVDNTDMLLNPFNNSPAETGLAYSSLGIKIAQPSNSEESDAPEAELRSIDKEQSQSTATDTSKPELQSGIISDSKADGVAKLQSSSAASSESKSKDNSKIEVRSGLFNPIDAKTSVDSTPQLNSGLPTQIDVSGDRLPKPLLHSSFSSPFGFSLNYGADYNPIIQQKPLANQLPFYHQPAINPYFDGIDNTQPINYPANYKRSIDANPGLGAYPYGYFIPYYKQSMPQQSYFDYLTRRKRDIGTVDSSLLNASNTSQAQETPIANRAIDLSSPNSTNSDIASRSNLSPQNSSSPILTNATSRFLNDAPAEFSPTNDEINLNIQRSPGFETPNNTFSFPSIRPNLPNVASSIAVRSGLENTNTQNSSGSDFVAPAQNVSGDATHISQRSVVAEPSLQTGVSDSNPDLRSGLPSANQSESLGRVVQNNDTSLMSGLPQSEAAGALPDSVSQRDTFAAQPNATQNTNSTASGAVAPNTADNSDTQTPLGSIKSMLASAWQTVVPLGGSEKPNEEPVVKVEGSYT